MSLDCVSYSAYLAVVIMRGTDVQSQRIKSKITTSKQNSLNSTKALNVRMVRRECMYSLSYQALVVVADELLG